MARFSSEIDFDKIYVTKHGERYQIVENLGKVMQPNFKRVTKVKIRFLDTGSEKIYPLTRVKQCEVSDNYFKDVCGIGYKGDAPKGYDPTIYSRWYSMISRCYNPNNASYYLYGGAGVTVCERWLCFANYLEDFQHLPGYQAFVNTPRSLKKFYDIDKDILQTGIPKCNRVYSPDTCLIVNQRANSIKAALDKAITKKSFIGAKFIPGMNIYKYECALSVNNVKFYIGRFSNEIAAASAYNHVAQFIPNSVLNPIEPLPVSEWIKFRDNSESMNVPDGVYFNSEVVSGVNIIYGNSIYNGISQVGENCWEASYKCNITNVTNTKKIIIGYYNNEFAALSAQEYYCRNNNLRSLNEVDNICLEEDLNKYNVLSPEEEYNKEYENKMLKQIAKNVQVGNHYFTPDGREYEVIEIDKPDRTSYLKAYATIKFVKTGYITKVITKVISDGSNIEDRSLASAGGIGVRPYNYCDQSIYDSRVKNLWYRLMTELKCIHPTDYDKYIKTEWLNFELFKKELPNIKNHNLFIQYCRENATIKVVMTNIETQYGIPLEEKIWNENTCYFCNYKISEIHNFIDSQYNKEWDLNNTRGSLKVSDNRYKMYINNPYTNTRYNAMYDNMIAATNMANHYYQYYYGIAPNINVPYMSIQDCQKHRIMRSPEGMQFLCKTILCESIKETEEEHQQRINRLKKEYKLTDDAIKCMKL